MAKMCERKREIKRRRQRKAERVKEQIKELKAQAAKAKKSKPA